MYECINCNIRWNNGFVKSSDTHICKLCNRNCKEPFDRNRCPECKKPTAMARPKAHDLNMICEHCKYEYTDQEAEKVLGVKKVQTVDHEGQPTSAFVNTGNGHEFFHSWYCLKRFKTYDQMKQHDMAYHKIGDKMAGCIPSGYIIDMNITCGNENTVPC